MAVDSPNNLEPGTLDSYGSDLTVPSDQVVPERLDVVVIFHPADAASKLTIHRGRKGTRTREYALNPVVPQYLWLPRHKALRLRVSGPHSPTHVTDE